MGRLILSEVNLIDPVDESTFAGKHIFRVASGSNSIYLQASNGVEMTDWFVPPSSHFLPGCRLIELV